MLVNWGEYNVTARMQILGSHGDGPTSGVILATSPLNVTSALIC